MLNELWKLTDSLSFSLGSIKETEDNNNNHVFFFLIVFLSFDSKLISFF